VIGPVFDLRQIKRPDVHVVSETPFISFSELTGQTCADKVKLWTTLRRCLSPFRPFDQFNGGLFLGRKD
jgi:hypothetical protein